MASRSVRVLWVSPSRALWTTAPDKDTLRVTVGPPTREQLMSSQNNEIAERFEMAVAANDVATIDELCDPALVDHNAAPDQKPGLAGFKDTLAQVAATFPDLQVSVQHVIGEGDLVATHWTLSGTHQAEFLGVPATGRKVTVEGMNVYRLAGGLITDMWTQLDGVGMRDQLGALPG